MQTRILGHGKLARCRFICETEEPPKTGYRMHLREYRATDGPACPLHAQGTTAQYRTIHGSPRLLWYQQAIRDQLPPRKHALLRNGGGWKSKASWPN